MPREHARATRNAASHRIIALVVPALLAMAAKCFAQGAPSRTLAGHEGPVTDVCFVAVDEVASCGNDGTIRRWSMRDGSLVQTIPSQGCGLTALAGWPGGDKVASVGDDGRIRIWSTYTGMESELVRTIPTGEEAVFCLDVSPSGESLAAGDGSGRVRIYSTSDGCLVRTVPATTAGQAVAVAFSPDGRVLAVGYSDGPIVLWSGDGARMLRSLEGHGGCIRSLAFSPLGVLASASEDGTIRTWNVESGEERITLRGGEGAVWAVDFSAWGDALVSGGEDRVVRVWDPSDGRVVRSLEGHEDVVLTVAFAPGTDYPIASAGYDGNVRLWSARIASSGGPTEEEVRRLVTEYYRTLGEWAGRYEIASVDRIRIASLDDSSWEAHVAYHYQSVSGSETGTDQRVFYLELTGRLWHVSGMGSHMSARFED